MIRIENVSKFFNDHQVLKNVSGEIKKGQVITLIGPSGSGKSTLLRCLNLMEKPTSGHIYYKDQDITASSFKPALMRQSVGMVFQNFHLFPHLSVLENITYAPIKVLKKTQDEAEAEALNLLQRVGLQEKANAYPKSLSGGQKQRVAIARCLAMSPDVILFDEPTSALDPEMVKEVLEVIKSLVHTHITCVLVTHEMAFAREIGDEVWFLDQGVLLEKTAPDTFFSTPQTERAKTFLQKVL